MKRRCFNPNDDSYYLYWWRWIKIYNRRLWMYWFDNFVQDMWFQPEWYTLDRINSDLWYHKENCRWADNHLQASNRRINNLYVWVNQRKDKKTKTWESRITINNNAYRLWYFKTQEEAYKARRDAELFYLWHYIEDGHYKNI